MLKHVIILMIVAFGLVGCKTSEFQMTKYGCKSMATGKFVNRELCR